MNIVVKANGGLGNRMRVLASCIALSNRLQLQLNVVWINNKALNCSYDKLFLPIKRINIINHRYIHSFNRIGLKLRKEKWERYGKHFDVQFGDSEVRIIRKLKSDFVKLIQGF